MKNLIVGALALLALASGSASAADLPIKSARESVPAVTWAGWYVGLNAGGGIAKGDMIELDCFSCASAGAFQRAFGSVGGQVGYNWQWGYLVGGIEADINWASLRAGGFWAQDDSCCHGPTQFKLDAFGSVRARAGLAMGPALLYLTAGPAWGHSDSYVLSVGQQPFVLRDKDWRFGLATGAGVDFMVAPNWTVGAEYLYMTFVDSVVPCQPLGSNTSCARIQFETNQLRINFANSTQVARVRLNYKFN